jgi:hypothetical protein
MRMWAFWDQAKLITQVQELRKRQSPLYAKYVLDNHKKLFSAALRQFGSWRKALVAARIEIPKYAYGSRLGILRALDDALHGQSTTDIPAPVKSSAVYYFGSLQTASLQQKENGLRHPRGGLQQRFLGCIERTKAWYMRKHDGTTCRWCVPPRSSSGVGVRRCMPQGLTRTCIMFVTNGANQ